LGASSFPYLLWQCGLSKLFCIDPLTTVREQCEQLEKCVKAQERLELCDEHVCSQSHTEEDCTEELFDFLHARDHCVAHKLFNNLK
ncbi:hypothetical protein EGK_05127, partial [Macaca mulatta]